MITSSLVVLSILASTLAFPPAEIPTIAIPIFKRSNIKKSDATVDRKAIRNSLDSSLRKIKSGFEAFEKNTGFPHPLSNGAKKALLKRATGSEPMTDGGEELWFGPIAIGTPPQNFTVAFNTGGADLLLPSSACGSPCNGIKVWNPLTSSTAINTGTHFTFTSSSGSAVSGTVFLDKVTIAGLNATGQAIGLIPSNPTGFPSSPSPDGLCGLAFPSISSSGRNDLFTTLVIEGQCAPQFGIKLADVGSELFLGGVNTNLFTGTFVNSPVIQPAFWEISLQGIGVNGVELLSGNVSAIVDTGTSFLIGDTADVQSIYGNIPGAKDASATIGPGFFTVPCDNLPTLFLVFGGTAFTISTDTFNLGQLFTGSPDCVGGLVGDDIGFWIIGDVFLRNVYTSFNKAAPFTVGFAHLA